MKLNLDGWRNQYGLDNWFYYRYWIAFCWICNYQGNVMFSLDETQHKKLAAWKKAQDVKVMEQQKGTKFEHSGEAYYGCSGGAYSYEFTPTSLGLIVKVRNGATEETIDLSDYDSW
jgi:hypothetical protein